MEPKADLPPPKIQLDNKMVIRARIFPIIILADRPNFLSFMRILFASALYDDALDDVFLIPQTTKHADDNKGSDMDVVVDFDRLALFLTNL